MWSSLKIEVMVVVRDVSVVGCVPNVGNLSVSFSSFTLNMINFSLIFACNGSYTVFLDFN